MGHILVVQTPSRSLKRATGATCLLGSQRADHTSTRRAKAKLQTASQPQLQSQHRCKMLGKMSKEPPSMRQREQSTWKSSLALSTHTLQGAGSCLQPSPTSSIHGELKVPILAMLPRGNDFQSTPAANSR